MGRQGGMNDSMWIPYNEIQQAPGHRFYDHHLAGSVRAFRYPSAP